jgi:hypothetical protein
MYEQLTDTEKHELARRLADISEVLDEDDARSLMFSNPERAIELLKTHERSREQLAELALTRERLRAVARG